MKDEVFRNKIIKFKNEAKEKGYPPIDITSDDIHTRTIKGSGTEMLVRNIGQQFIPHF